MERGKNAGSSLFLGCRSGFVILLYAVVCMAGRFPGIQCAGVDLAESKRGIVSDVAKRHISCALRKDFRRTLGSKSTSVFLPEKDHFARRLVLPGLETVDINSAGNR